MERALTGLSRLTTKKSTKDLHGMSGQQKDWPTEASDYQLLDDCGRGVSATVHRALCLPLNEIVAVKKMNLESMQCDLDEIIHEAQTMKHYNHPNVLPLYTSFVNGQDLWMVMPFVAGGSVLHIMKYAYPEGLDEVVIATIGREVLKALDYVHSKNGGIHRDVKAGNVLVDRDGSVKLADFGVAATLERGASWGHDKHSRMTFVGTPCWMAPEVMEQQAGYNSSADIWSLGITLLEMAHGHAPFAKFPPMKVLLMTLQNPAPTLEDKGKKHFSKSMRDVVTRCLSKEADKRPTAAQLLEHKFFKQAKDEEYIVKHVLANLPSLAERVQLIRQGKAATTREENDRNHEISQEEYKKGVSSWNFDVAALKAQAALEPDEDIIQLPTIRESDEREDTLSGQAANDAAASFVALQGRSANEQAGSRSGSAEMDKSSAGYVSAFATILGQEALAKNHAIQPAVGPPPALNVPDVVLPTQTSATTPINGNGPEGPMSPNGHGTNSPLGLSREGSMGGHLNTLANTPTNHAPTKQKKGRFEVIESGGYRSDFSLSNISTSAAANAVSGTTDSARTSISGIPGGSDLPFRSSEDGNGRVRTLLLDGKDDKDVEESVTSLQPMQRGRFKVVAEQSSELRPSMSKASSYINLTEGTKDPNKSKSDGGGSILGRPPTAPIIAQPPVSVVLPKLQELLEHAAAHHQALQKLVSAVHESEKGRLPMLLSRSQSTKSLFSEREGDADDLRAQMAELRQRVLALEDENARLKTRNQQLETLHSASEAIASTAAAGAQSPAGHNHHTYSNLRLVAGPDSHVISPSSVGSPRGDGL